MKPIAILCFSCFVFLVPAHADIMVQAENGSQNSVDFQVLTQATVSLSFEILGAPTSANCAPVDPTQLWGCLGGLSQNASMSSVGEFGIGGAFIGVYGGYSYIGSAEDTFNLQYDCDGTVCGSPNAPWCQAESDGFICSTTLTPGSYSISAGDYDSLVSGLPHGTPGNSTVIPFNESVEATLYVGSGIVTSVPEPGSMALLSIGLVVFLWRMKSTAVQRALVAR